jgi:hypothetical protein
VQVPREPEIEHEVHALVHAVAQQTPSARKPLAQLDAEVALAPFGNVAVAGVQTPTPAVIVHVAPPTQSVSTAQLVLQPESEQPYGAQLIGVGAAHA